MPSLDRITVYPIKSFDGHDLTACRVLPNGALIEDRRFALVDGWGKFVNGKNCPGIHRIRAAYSEDLQNVTLNCDGRRDDFDLAAEQDRLAAWCGEMLGMKCRLIENGEGGFPDDSESSGPTLVSTSSLQAITQWFDGIDLMEVRRRFRFNLEVADAPAFWEDGLVPELHKVRRFRVGELAWQGSGVCKRCVVPTRDSHNGAVSSSFVRDFVRLREASLPDWAPRDRFDTFYRLGVNTRLDSRDNENVVRLGDPVELTQ